MAVYRVDAAMSCAGVEDVVDIVVVLEEKKILASLCTRGIILG